MSNHPRWLDRWLQADDDELLYVDQTLILEPDQPCDEHQDEAPPEEEPTDLEAYL